MQKLEKQNFRARDLLKAIWRSVNMTSMRKRWLFIGWRWEASVDCTRLLDAKVKRAVKAKFSVLLRTSMILKFCQATVYCTLSILTKLQESSKVVNGNQLRSDQKHGRESRSRNYKRTSLQNNTIQKMMFNACILERLAQTFCWVLVALQVTSLALSLDGWWTTIGLSLRGWTDVQECGGCVSLPFSSAISSANGWLM